MNEQSKWYCRRCEDINEHAHWHRRCEDINEHAHWYDTAHGIEATHMAGSERYVCNICGLVTHVNDEGAYHFIFRFDKPLE